MVYYLPFLVYRLCHIYWQITDIRYCCVTVVCVWQVSLRSLESFCIALDKLNIASVWNSCIIVDRLKSAGIPLRLCSNTSTKSTRAVAETLTSLGFDILPHEVFTPIPAVQQYLRQNKLRPYIIVDPGQYHRDTSDVIMYLDPCVCLCLSVCMLCVCSHILWTKYLEKHISFFDQTSAQSLVIGDLKVIRFWKWCNSKTYFCPKLKN